jgi:hypothetical protein
MCLAAAAAAADCADGFGRFYVFICLLFPSDNPFMGFFILLGKASIRIDSCKKMG